RISIARTLLTNPPILILDDVTSSVDLKTELEIEKSLEKILVNKSSITVTHRTKVMKKLDKILFIEDGKIQDQGKHDELYATNQKYRSLCQSFENKNTKKEVR
ncbi:MAG: ABC transporter ATP-binding protein, partial [Dehalococcoidia bacterium]